METATKTLRLRGDLRSEIEQIAKRKHRSFSEVTQDLIEEALKIRKCPGIYFADEPAGREAKIMGTGLGVWEVISVQKEVSKNERALHSCFHWLNEAQIKAALLYYARYPAEIDELIAENAAIAEELRGKSHTR